MRRPVTQCLLLFFMQFLFGLSLSAKAQLVQVSNSGDKSYDLMQAKVEQLLLTEKFKPALAVVNDAISRYPDDALLYARLCRIYAVLEDDDKFDSSFKKFLQLTKNKNMRAYTDAVEAAGLVERREDALKLAREAVKRMGNIAQIRFLAGCTERKCGNMAAAEAQFVEAVKLDPSVLHCWQELLAAHRQLRHWPALVRDGEAAYARFKDDQQVRKRLTFSRCVSDLAEGYYNVGRYKDAQSMLRICMKISPLDRKLLARHLDVSRKLDDKASVARDQQLLLDFDDGL